MTKLVIWDWNGTLLDDAELAVQMNNLVWPAFGCATHETVYDYRRLFRFPVKAYYLSRGITEEVFPKVAKAWSDAYREHFREAALRKDSLATVCALQNAGVRQVIISASKDVYLKEQVNYFFGANAPFEALVGLSDIYAVSKEQLVRNYLARAGVENDEVVMIGDTHHDGDIARSVGVHCILVKGGHQLPEILADCGWPVADSLTDVLARMA